MKIHMSRGRFESLSAGLSPIEKEKLAGCVHIWTEEQLVEWNVDQQRIGAAYQRLYDDYRMWKWRWRSRSRTWFGPILSPRRGGKASSFTPSPPWQEVAPGVWVAPPDTPPPGGGPIDLDQLAAELVYEEPAADRYFLNDVVTASPPADYLKKVIDVDDLRQLLAYYARVPDLGPRRLHAGDVAIAAIVAAYPPAPKRLPWEPQPIGQLGAIQIIPDPGMAPNAWKLVDPVSGDTVFEGTAGPSVQEYEASVSAMVDELAEASGVPRDLLWPPDNSA